MESLKPHTHEQRRQIAEEMLWLLKKRFGDNLLALGSVGSFARGDDGPYSDLEIVALLEEAPADGSLGFGKIFQGILVEVLWKTVPAYLERVKMINPEWYRAGSAHLLPLFNPELIHWVNRQALPEGWEAQCDKMIPKQWCEVQEACGKVLNAIDRDKGIALPLLAVNMLHQMLIILAWANHRPFTTLAKFVEEGLAFLIQPAHFPEFCMGLSKGEFTDRLTFRSKVVTVFEELEELLSGRGHRLYDNSHRLNI